jgi:hypothetical protein
MQKIKEILRLRYEVRLSYRGIHQALNIGYGTVCIHLWSLGLSWVDL